MPPPTPNSEEPLNAPFGARCFLTCRIVILGLVERCLNAPFGARCFLTSFWQSYGAISLIFLMHLLAPGTF